MNCSPFQGHSSAVKPRASCSGYPSASGGGVTLSTHELPDHPRLHVIQPWALGDGLHSGQLCSIPQNSGALKADSDPAIRQSGLKSSVIPLVSVDSQHFSVCGHHVSVGGHSVTIRSGPVTCLSVVEPPIRTPPGWRFGAAPPPEFSHLRNFSSQVSEVLRGQSRPATDFPFVKTGGSGASVSRETALWTRVGIRPQPSWGSISPAPRSVLALSKVARRGDLVRHCTFERGVFHVKRAASVADHRF